MSVVWNVSLAVSILEGALIAFALCPATASAGTIARADLGDGNDRAVIDHMVQGNPVVEVLGGTGADELKAIGANTRLTLDGGPTGATAARTRTAGPSGWPSTASPTTVGPARTTMSATWTCSSCSCRRRSSGLMAPNAVEIYVAAGSVATTITVRR